jgi:hypothetical protein
MGDSAILAVLPHLLMPGLSQMIGQFAPNA